MVGRFFSGCLTAIGTFVVVFVAGAVIIGLFAARHDSQTPVQAPVAAPSAPVATESPSAPAERIQTPPEPETPPSSPREIVTVSAATMDAVYAANEEAGDERYQDKTLRVYGIVNGIDKSLFGDIHVALIGAGETLYGSGSPFGVDAKLNPGNEHAAGRLLRWQPVRMVCNDVSRAMHTVMLSDCDIDLTNDKWQLETDAKPSAQQ